MQKSIMYQLYQLLSEETFYFVQLKLGLYVTV